MLTRPEVRSTHEHHQHERSGGVGDDEHPAAVEPVGEHSGEQPEEQPRQLLEHRRQRDQDRVVGSARRSAAGPAARAMPSPRLESHEEARRTSRNGRPSRAGTTDSTRRLTRARH